MIGARLLEFDAAGALSALAFLLVALATRAHAWRRPMLFALAGTIASALFIVRTSAWVDVVALFSMGVTSVAILPSWRGYARDLPGLARDAIPLFVSALVVPMLIAIVAAATATGGELARAIAVAMPESPVPAMLETELAVLAVILALDGTRAHRPHAKLLAALACTAAGGVLAMRAAWIASMASLPTETFWSEAPFLVNALKLDAGEPLYGPLADLNSYMYSPLLELVHHALLAPLGLELSLHANRALVVIDELAATAVIGWSLAPKLRGMQRALGPLGAPWVVATLACAALSNMLAATVHPDHALLLAFAFAIALVVAERRWPRALWWGALFFVTPLAASAKLSGAAIGLALAATFAIERRWRVVAVLAASGAVSLATFPLYDATLGHEYTLTTLRLVAIHPMEWGRARDLANGPIAFATVVVVAAFMWLSQSSRASRATKRAVVLVTVVAIGSLPAYLKHGGRENNLTLWLVGCVVLILLRAADARARRPHPALALIVSLLIVVAFRPPERLLPRSVRDGSARAFARIVDVIHRDDDAGRHTLLLMHVAPRIAAGHRDVPHDRFASAVNLFTSRRPEAQIFFNHIEDGRYDTVVLPPPTTTAGATGEFTARVTESLARRYGRCQGPLRDVPSDADGIIVLCRL